MDEEKEEKTHPIKYMSFGAPLMDCIADVSKEFLERNKIEINSTSHKKLSEIQFLDEFLTQHEIQFLPGGCQFNAMRVFNWMLSKDKTDVVGFLGSIGKTDSYGNIYQDLLKKENIIPVFETIDKETTGLCLVMCCDRDRSHITDIGASFSISEDWVERNWDKFQEVKLIYTELFILKAKKNICFKIAELGLRDETYYGFNLPPDFILKNYINDIKQIYEYADIVFANEFEALELCKLLNFEVGTNETIKDITLQLCRNIPKKNKRKKRIVVVTCGPNPAYCCQYDHIKNEILFQDSFEVVDVPQEEIVDTNGAGDSFAGGFLSQFMKGKSLDKCMKAGHWAASVIIKRRGFQIPNDFTYDVNDHENINEK